MRLQLLPRAVLGFICIQAASCLPGALRNRRQLAPLFSTGVTVSTPAPTHGTFYGTHHRHRTLNGTHHTRTNHTRTNYDASDTPATGRGFLGEPTPVPGSLTHDPFPGVSPVGVLTPLPGFPEGEPIIIVYPEPDAPKPRPISTTTVYTNLTSRPSDTPATGRGEGESHSAPTALPSKTSDTPSSGRGESEPHSAPETTQPSSSQRSIVTIVTTTTSTSSGPSSRSS